jgi:hypothetical protein
MTHMLSRYWVAYMRAWDGNPLVPIKPETWGCARGQLIFQSTAYFGFMMALFYSMPSIA